MKYPQTTFTYDHLVRARLRALTVRHGHGSFTGLSAAMGKHRTWLRRKLDPRSARPTPVTLVDVDAILAFLGEPPSAVMAPVLLPGDQEVLSYLLVDAVAPTLNGIESLFADGAAVVARMLDQGLMVEIGGTLHLTKLARKLF